MSNKPSKLVITALTGTIVAAVCCFTPVLVTLLAVVGLSAFTPYLDYVLLPTLGLFLVLTVVSYTHWKKSARS